MLEVPQKDAYQATVENSKTRYKFPGNTECYLYSEIWQQAVVNTITRLETINNNKMELDLTYDNLCQDVFEELDHNLQYKFCGSKLKEKYRISKPYWNEHLGNLWQIMVHKENKSIKYKGVNKSIKMN